MDSTVRRSIKENNRQLQQFTVVIWRLECFQLSYSKLYDTVFHGAIMDAILFILKGCGKIPENEKEA